MLIDGPQLRGIQRLLGLAQSQLTSITEIDTENLSQVISLTPDLLRRANVPQASTGLFMGVMENVHGAADDESSTIDPYAPGAVIGVGGYPATVGDELDVWILSASLLRTSGAGDVNQATLRLGTGASSRFLGWGIDDLGAAVVSEDAPLITAFAAFNAATGGAPAFAPEVGSGLAQARIAMRIRRGFDIIFNSTSNGIVTCRLVMQIGLFPEGLGQDVLT